MNNKGFTLIELIIVIAILSLIALLSAPNVLKLINKNKADNYNGMIDSIIKSTKLYVSDNKNELKFVADNGQENFCKPNEDKNIHSSITLNELINSKSISSPVVNPCTKTNISENTKIKITLNCKTKQFSYFIEDLKKINNCDELK